MCCPARAAAGGGGAKPWSSGSVAARYDPAVFLHGTKRAGGDVWSLVIPLQVGDGRGVGKPAAVRWFQGVGDAAFGVAGKSASG